MADKVIPAVKAEEAEEVAEEQDLVDPQTVLRVRSIIQFQQGLKNFIINIFEPC